MIALRNGSGQRATVRTSVRSVAVVAAWVGTLCAASCAIDESGNAGPANGGTSSGGGTSGGAEAGTSAMAGSPSGGTSGSAASAGEGGIESVGGGPTAGVATGGGSNPCEAPAIWCNTSSFVGCAALGTNDHCSACADACAESEECVEGDDGMACTCPSGQTRCSGECVDTEDNPNHCGGCDVVCGTNALCADGTCGCTDPDYPDEHENEVTERVDCYNFDTDPAHCGDYDTTCLPGEECIEKQCDCADTHCPENGDPEVCTDLAIDPENCLTCGNRCAENGVCKSTGCDCPTGTQLCGGGGADPGICTDTQTDPLHCGDTCAPCGEGFDCVAGSCSCSTGDTCQNNGAEVCVDFTTDERFCGGCGTHCQNDEECHGGECIDSPCDQFCTDPEHMDPEGTVKEVGCYELFGSDILETTNPRIVGWEFSWDNGATTFALEVNGEPWPTFTDGADHDLPEPRLGGWCIEVTSGHANIYAPND